MEDAESDVMAFGTVYGANVKDWGGDTAMGAAPTPLNAAVAPPTKAEADEDDDALAATGARVPPRLTGPGEESDAISDPVAYGSCCGVLLRLGNEYPVGGRPPVASVGIAAVGTAAVIAMPGNS